MALKTNQTQTDLKKYRENHDEILLKPKESFKAECTGEFKKYFKHRKKNEKGE